MNSLTHLLNMLLVKFTTFFSKNKVGEVDEQGPQGDSRPTGLQVMVDPEVVEIGIQEIWYDLFKRANRRPGTGRIKTLATALAEEGVHVWSTTVRGDGDADDIRRLVFHHNAEDRNKTKASIEADMVYLSRDPETIEKWLIDIVNLYGLLINSTDELKWWDAQFANPVTVTTTRVV